MLENHVLTGLFTTDPKKLQYYKTQQKQQRHTGPAWLALLLAPAASLP